MSEGSRVVPMTEANLEQVLAIESASFPTPWPRAHFLSEIRGHRYAFNVVLKWREEVLGYACLWILDAELKINNIAIQPACRKRGLGTRLLRWVLNEGVFRGCREATLEVRPSNQAARNLYRRHGFREVGRRRGYYSDTREDAILMVASLGEPYGSR